MMIHRELGLAEVEGKESWCLQGECEAREDCILIKCQEG